MWNNSHVLRLTMYRTKISRSMWIFKYSYISSRSNTVLSTYVRVRKKDRRKGGGKGEDSHVPSVARDQPNGFRLTPHTPFENQSTPSLVTLAEPPGNAGSKHARRNTVILLALVSIPFVPSLLIRFSSSSPRLQSRGKLPRFATPASGQYLCDDFRGSPPWILVHFPSWFLGRFSKIEFIR